MPTSLFTRAARATLIISLIGVTILSLVPVTGSLAVNIWDKAQHAGAYVYLTLLVWAASEPRRLTARHASLLMAYGIGIEGLQAGLPWRSFSLMDMVANASGIGIGGVILISAQTLSPTRRKTRQTKKETSDQ